MWVVKENNEKLRICVATSTRADWGLLEPLARCLRSATGVELLIVATNMHLMPQFGMTVDEITEAGFEVAARVPMEAEGDTEASRVRAMACCMAGMADALERLHPDVLIVLGDRYEMLAVASAAAVMHIPIVHIAGGEISEGANDDSFRHAITKLSTLHLTATEPYRRRVIQMGEEPDRVVNTGAIGVWNALNITPLPVADLEAFLNFKIEGERVAIVTYHPATNETELTPAEATRQLLAALDAFPELKCVITYPNNDAGGASIIRLIEEYAAAHPDRVRAVPSLGMRRYHSLLRHAALVVGNSSSGIVEVPSYGIPTVDVGIRQRGRLAAPSVIHCGVRTPQITEAIAEALASDFNGVENPYYKPDTLRLMADAVLEFAAGLPARPKHFYDLKQ